MSKDKIKTELNIQELDINLIKPYWRNPRKGGGVEQIKISIEKFGYSVPITVDKDYFIITGHQRFLAIKELGLKKVPCVIKDDLTEQQIKEFRIADNKLSELSEWDEDLLRREIQDLESVVGFEQSEINNILGIMEEETKGDTADSLEDPETEDVGMTQEERLAKLEKEEEKFKKREEKESKKFEDITEKSKNDLLKLICPHCLKEFEMKRGDIDKE